MSDITEPSHAGSTLGLLYKKSGNDGIFWKPDAAGTEVDLTTAPQYVRTAISANYTVLVSDQIIGVDTTSQAVTVTFPQISTIGTTNNYKLFNVVDEEGNSEVNNITIQTSGSDTINKSSDPVIIAVNHTSLTFYNDGVSNWIIK